MRKLLFVLAMSLLTAAANASACLQSPIPGTIITSNFGFRLQPVYKIWRPHNGMDLRAAMMTKVYAAQPGQVTFSGYMSSSGNTVIVLGPDGLQTRYFHLTKAGVRENMSVNAGDIIGLSGNTGEASAAPHLHFEARKSSGSQPVDPRSLLCQSLPEKAGAGPDATSDGSSQPGSNGSVEPRSPSNIKFNSEPNFNGYSTMSEQDMLKSEAERRFMNPDWHQVVGGCGGDLNQTMVDGKTYSHKDCDAFFKNEMIMMTALRNYLRYKTRAVFEDIDAMNAARTVDMVKASRVNLDAIKARAESQAD